jgi:hypothetical protein
MKKRDKQKPKKEIKAEIPNNPETAEKPAEAAIANENPFDFGGLPKRDLKKNLGCG